MRYYLKVLVFLFFYCCSKTPENTEKLFVKSFEEIESISFNDTSFFDSCYIVRLETHSECLITQVADLQVFDQLLFIFDNAQNTIYVFNKTGRYLNKIGKIGRGPEEYLSATGFFIDKTDSTVNILDPYNLSVVKYNFEGEFINKIPHNNKNYSYLRQIRQIDEDRFFCYFGVSPSEENLMYGIVNKKDFSDILVLYNYPFKSKVSYLLSLQPFFVNENMVKITYPFSNNVYDYINKTSFTVETGKKDISSKLLKNKFIVAEKNYSTLLQDLNKENTYNLGFNNYFENERYIFFDQREELSIKGYIWDKQLNKGFKIKNYITYKPQLSMTNFTDGNSVIRIWNNSLIDSFMEDIIEEPHSNFHTLLEGYDVEYDNPILIFYTFKVKDI